MSLLKQKDVSLLIDAGFSYADIGLMSGGKRGVELYESPDDYFAREIIENACESGLCDLYEDLSNPIPMEPYDTSRKDVRADNEYAGNDDLLEGIEQNLIPQVQFLKTIKLGRLSIWQEFNGKKLKWRVKELFIEIPPEEKIRMLRLSDVDQKELWKKYAAKEWQQCWKAAANSLWSHIIDKCIQIKTDTTVLDAIVFEADNLRKIGYNNLPGEAKWVSMIYFEKS